MVGSGKGGQQGGWDWVYVSPWERASSQWGQSWTGGWLLSPDLWLVTALAVSYSLPLILLAWASCVASWLPRADGLPTHLEKIRDWAASV